MVLAHDGPVGFAGFSPDGKRILTRVGRGAQIWDRASGQIIAMLPPYSKTAYGPPRFSPTAGGCSRQAIISRIFGTAKRAADGHTDRTRSGS